MSAAREERLRAIRARTLRELARMPPRIGRYRILGELGRGGMGVVYHAYDEELDRHVALKRIDRGRFDARNAEEFVERFRREMRATSDLFHPNLVAILDAGVDSGFPFYVMERVEGESLEQRLRRRGRLSRRESLGLAAEVARGLSAAHGRGLVHRDLKPSNVLLPRAGEAKVVDFGLCLCLGQDEPGDDREWIVGSAHYLSPEQVQGGSVEGRADLFALGAMTARMLSGRMPFGSDSLASHLERVASGTPDGVEELDADLRDLMLRLMAKDPADRPASADAVVAELAELVSADRPPGFAARLRHLRPGSVAALAAALASTAVVAAGFLLRAELVTLDVAAATQWRRVEAQQARLAGWSSGPARASASELHAEAQRTWLHEVSGARNRLATEARRYNAAVGSLERKLRTAPWRWLRGGIEPRQYYSLPRFAPDPPGEGATSEAESRLRDEAELLDGAARARLEHELALLERETGIGASVWLGRLAAGETLERFATVWSERGATGEPAPPRTLALLLDVGAGRVRIAPGYELESLLPDGLLGDVLEGHTRYEIARDPERAVRLTLRMLRYRVRLARLRDDWHEVGAGSEHRVGGAGASARIAPGAREAARADGESWPPGADPLATHEEYLGWLSAGARPSDAAGPALPAFLTADSRTFLASWPLTPGYLEFVHRRERAAQFASREAGDRAVVYATDDPLVAPHFFRRAPDGWRMDLVAEVDEVVNVDAGPFTWSLRWGEYTRTFADLVIEREGFLRLRDGDNRPLRLHRTAALP